MTTTDVERAAHAATVALADFDRAGATQVLQTVPALAQTLRELLAAVTAHTPPADDVREAVAVLVKQVSQKFGGPSMAEFANDPPIRKHYATADAILAAFEVRPRGPVTFAEVDAAAEVYGGYITFDRVRAMLEAAREA